jgi:small subunit ribosomal protein S2
MSNKVEVKELLEAGVHFGHMTRKWDQIWLLTFIWNVMVFTLSIYINCSKIEEANEALKKIAASGRKILRSYKKQAKDIVAEKQKLQTCPLLKDGLVEC